MGVLHHQAAHRRPAHMDVEDPAAHLGGRLEALVLERRAREALADRIFALAALVDGEAPAGVVVLGLADHRVFRLEQFVPH
jgi:hypothetical protein